MLEIERIEAAAPVLDALRSTWYGRQAVMAEMYANKRRLGWAKKDATRSLYAAKADEMGRLAHDLDEAMTQWIQWLLARKLVKQADVYRAMDGRPTSRGPGSARSALVNAGRDAARAHRPKILVEAPEIPEYLKNRLEIPVRPTEVEKAKVLRNMYDARQAMRLVDWKTQPYEYAWRTDEFRQALVDVWGLYSGATLRRVCKTSSNGWLTKHYEAHMEGAR